MEFTCLKARATLRRQFTFVPMSKFFPKKHNQPSISTALLQPYSFSKLVAIGSWVPRIHWIVPEFLWCLKCSWKRTLSVFFLNVVNVHIFLKIWSKETQISGKTNVSPSTQGIPQGNNQHRKVWTVDICIVFFFFLQSKQFHHVKFKSFLQPFYEIDLTLFGVIIALSTAKNEFPDNMYCL